MWKGKPAPRGYIEVEDIYNVFDVKLFCAARSAGAFDRFAEADDRSPAEQATVILNYLSGRGKSRLWTDAWTFQAVTERLHAALCAGYEPERQRILFHRALADAVAYDYITSLERSQAKSWLRAQLAAGRGK